MELLLIHLPHTPQLREFMARFMKNHLAVVLQNEVALVLDLLCCTRLLNDLQMPSLRCICLYRPPRIIEDHLLFECFDQRC